MFNRAGTPHNALRFCGACGKGFPNNRHLASAHPDCCRPRLMAFAGGMCRAGLRGPFHRGTVMRDAAAAAQAGRPQLERYLENLLRCAGVGLQDSAIGTVPVYDMDTVFLRTETVPRPDAVVAAMGAEEEDGDVPDGECSARRCWCV